MGGLFIDPLTRDAAFTLSGDLQQADNPAAAHAHRRLATRRGSVVWDVEFGSTLHEIRTLDAQTTQRVEASVKGALRPMVEAGEISHLVVSAERSSEVPGRVDFVVDAVDALQRPFRIPSWVQV